MFDDIKNFSILGAIREISAKNPSLLTRPQHTFLYRPRGSAQYTFDDSIITSNKYDLVFLPKGCKYFFSISDIDECWCSLITFEADIPDAKPIKFSLENFADAEYIFSRFPALWNFGNQSDRFKCLSEFFEFLSFIMRTEQLKGIEPEKFRIIDPAIHYLKDHLFDADLRVSRLSHLCGVSDTYFRKLFISRFLVTPQLYIQRERLERARHIIESGDYDCIASVAESVGYVDPLYFSKAFRKQYGFPPSSLFE